MNSEDLNVFLARYEPTRIDKKAHFKELEDLRKEFIKAFPPSKIPNLDIDDYVQGKQSDKSFCYWVEWKTTYLGKIQGARADKFGLYYGSDKSYKFLKRYSSAKEALKHLTGEISNLIIYGKNQDYARINEVELSPMFKGKILFLYYPDKYLNVFTDSHIDHFLISLGIYDKHKNDNLVLKRAALLSLKQSHFLMRNWSTFEYTDFLYSSFQRPMKSSDVPEPLKPYIDAEDEYIDPEKANASFVALNLAPISSQSIPPNTPLKRRPIDFDSENKRKRRLGNHGELVVYYNELKKLKRLGLPNLALKVKHISEEDAAAGFDILSFDKEGNELHIEVKSTTAPLSPECRFMITANELRVANLDDHYFLYLVFRANSATPEILMLSSIKSLLNTSIILEPINYRARLFPNAYP